MFGPLIIVFVAVLSSVFLDETLHLGMYVAPALALALTPAMRIGLVLFFHGRCGVWLPFLQRAGRRPDRGRPGLYMVLWGKAREAQEKAAGVLPQDEEQGEESAAQDDAANAETK